MYGKPLPVGKPAPAPVKGKPMPTKGKPVPKGTMGDGVGGYNRPKGMAKGGATKKGMAKGGMTKKGCK